jgi:hypothetical protein
MTSESWGKKRVEKRFAYVRLPRLVYGLLVVEQHLDSLDELLGDGVEESVLGLDLVLDQQLNHLQVFIVDGHQQGTPA